MNEEELTMYGLSRRIGLVIMLVVCMILVGIPWAEDRPSASGQPALPGEACQTESYPDWTEQEKWVWKRVCEGKIADFNEAEELRKPLDPKAPEKWPAKRVLRPEFLETILLYEPWRSATPRQGVRIGGAWFTESLNLSSAELIRELWLVHSRFESNTNLSGLKTSGFIIFHGSVFMHELNMNSLEVKGHLLMRDGQFADVDLRGTKIEGSLELLRAAVSGMLNMDGLQVKSVLMMSNGRFAEGGPSQLIRLRVATIGSGLYLEGTKLPSFYLVVYSSSQVKRRSTA